MPPEDGGYAFPRRLPNVTVPPDEAYRLVLAYSGMTLRDYFAAKAMHAEITTCGQDEGSGIALAGAAAAAGQTIPERIAILAYQMADAMIAERSKEKI